MVEVTDGPAMELMIFFKVMRMFHLADMQMLHSSTLLTALRVRRPFNSNSRAV